MIIAMDTAFRKIFLRMFFAILLTVVLFGCEAKQENETNENMAYQKNVGTSSFESVQYHAKYAVDGDMTTRWSSAYMDDQFFIIDLGEQKSFQYILLIWETAYTKRYEVQVSDDNSNYTTIYTEENGKGETEIIHLPKTKAQYIKLNLHERATEYGNSLYEVGVYAKEPDVVDITSEPAIEDSVYNDALASLSPVVYTEEIDVLSFIESIRGQYTISSIHNREPNAQPDKQTNEILNRTGLHPAMWSGDFLFSSADVTNRQNMIEECKNQWEQGAIVNLMLHVTAPTKSEIGVWDGDVLCKLTDEEWSDLITDGGELNLVWKNRLDGYAEYFQYLKEHNVTVMFRPFHEMNQSAFWWGGRPGENGTAALYRLTRDYMVNEKQLDNIIWVWNMQDLDYNWAAYNPGSQYFDIFSVDFYNGDGFTKRKYETALEVADGKPMGIGECDVLPTAKELTEQPEWVFFMSWAELTFEKNDNSKIQRLYTDPRVLVREELPKLK